MTTSTKQSPVRYINVSICGVTLGIGLFMPKSVKTDADKIQKLLATAPIDKVESVIQEMGIDFLSVREASGAVKKDALSALMSKLGMDEEEQEQPTDADEEGF